MLPLHKAKNEKQQEERSDYHDVLHAPFIAGFSEQLVKDLKPIHTGLTFQKGRTILITTQCANQSNIQMIEKYYLLYQLQIL